ncbi:MAG: hypothetical protein BWK79_03110 [Beggiatoa sp. IS2]|nr:MAG: hypothetical protein BWK79_03110 [Beggiatoa sp. IS2]
MDKEFLCIAHRGAMGHEPENTLLAIEKAITLGALWVEIDVHYVDNHLVVIHDEKLHFPTGEIDIKQQSFAWLRTLDVGKGQKIPTLSEVLDLIKGRAHLNIELKGDNTAQPVCDVITEYCTKYGWKYTDFFISSFKYAELAKTRALLPTMNIGILLDNFTAPYFEQAKMLKAKFLNVNQEMVTADFIQQAATKNLRVLVYTVNSCEDMLKMKNLGVSGIFTNFPEKCLKMSG